MTIIKRRPSSLTDRSYKWQCIAFFLRVSFLYHR